MHISKITLFIIALIFASSIFAQRFWVWLGNIFGQGNVIIFSYILFSLFVIFFLVQKKRQGYKISKIFYAGIIIFISALLSLRIELFAERVHLFEFGLLGWFVRNDFARNSQQRFKLVVFSLLFILLISSVDELLQWFLPYRVGQMRDVLFNLSGGLIGVILYSLFYPPHPNPEKGRMRGKACLPAGRGEGINN